MVTSRSPKPLLRVRVLLPLPKALRTRVLKAYFLLFFIFPKVIVVLKVIDKRYKQLRNTSPRLDFQIMCDIIISTNIIYLGIKMNIDVAFDFTSDTPNYWNNFWYDGFLAEAVPTQML